MGLAQNAHTWQFSLNSLKYVMETSGFEFVCGNEEIKSIFKVANVCRDKGNTPQDEFGKALTFLINSERRYLARLHVIRFLELIGAKKVVKKIIGR